jgi:hypothetical protein
VYPNDLSWANDAILKRNKQLVNIVFIVLVDYLCKEIN